MKSNDRENHFIEMNMEVKIFIWYVLRMITSNTLTSLRILQILTHYKTSIYLIIPMRLTVIKKKPVCSHLNFYKFLN